MLRKQIQRNFAVSFCTTNDTTNLVLYNTNLKILSCLIHKQAISQIFFVIQDVVGWFLNVCRVRTIYSKAFLSLNFVIELLNNYHSLSNLSHRSGFIYFPFPILWCFNFLIWGLNSGIYIFYNVSLQTSSSLAIDEQQVFATYKSTILVIFKGKIQ